MAGWAAGANRKSRRRRRAAPAGPQRSGGPRRRPGLRHAAAGLEGSDAHPARSSAGGQRRRAWRGDHSHCASAHRFRQEPIKAALSKPAVRRGGVRADLGASRRRALRPDRACHAESERHSGLWRLRSGPPVYAQSIPAFHCGFARHHVSDRSLTATCLSTGSRLPASARYSGSSCAGVVVLSEVGCAASPWATSVRCLSVTRAVLAATIATRSSAPSSRSDDPLKRAELDLLSSCRGWPGPFELGAVYPDAMQDHRQLPRDRDPRLARAYPLAQSQPPGFQR